MNYHQQSTYYTLSDSSYNNPAVIPQKRTEFKTTKQYDLQSQVISPSKEATFISPYQGSGDKQLDLCDIKKIQNPQRVEQQTCLSGKDNQLNSPYSLSSYQPIISKNVLEHKNLIRPEFSFQKESFNSFGDLSSRIRSKDDLIINPSHPNNMDKKVNIKNDKNTLEQYISDISSSQNHQFLDNLQIQQRAISSSSSQQNSFNPPLTPNGGNSNKNFKSLLIESNKSQENEQIFQESEQDRQTNCQIFQLEDKLIDVTPIRQIYFQNMIQDIKKEKDREQCSIEKLINMKKWNPIDIKGIESLKRRIRDIGIEMNDLKDLSNTQTDRLPSLYYNPFRASKQYTEFNQYQRRSNSASQIQTIIRTTSQNHPSKTVKQEVPFQNERLPIKRTAYTELKSYKSSSPIYEQTENFSNKFIYKDQDTHQQNSNNSQDIPNNIPYNIPSSFLDKRTLFSSQQSSATFPQIVIQNYQNSDTFHTLESISSNQPHSANNESLSQNFDLQYNNSSQMGDVKIHKQNQPNNFIYSGAFKINNLNHHKRAQSIGSYNMLELNNQQNKYNLQPQLGQPFDFIYNSSSQIEKKIDQSELNNLNENTDIHKNISNLVHINKISSQKMSDRDIQYQERNDDTEQEDQLQELNRIVSIKKISKENSRNGDDLENSQHQNNKKQDIFSNNKRRKSLESHQSSRYSNYDEELEEHKENCNTPCQQKQYGFELNNNSIDLHNNSDKKKLKQISAQKSDWNQSQLNNSKRQSSKKADSDLTTDCYSQSVPRNKPVNNIEEFFQTPQPVKQFDPLSENQYLSKNKHELNLLDSQDKNNSNFQQLIQSVKLNEHETNQQQQRQQKFDPPPQFENDIEQNCRQYQQPSINLAQNNKIPSNETNLPQNYLFNKPEQCDNTKTDKNQLSSQKQIEQRSDNENLYLDKIIYLQKCQQASLQREHDSSRSGDLCINDSINTLNLDFNQVCLNKNSKRENEIKDTNSQQKNSSPGFYSYRNEQQPEGMNEINSFVSSQQRLNTIYTLADQEQGQILKNFNNSHQNQIGLSNITVNQDECSYYSDKDSFARISQYQNENFLKDDKSQEQLQQHENIPHFKQREEILTEKQNQKKLENEIQKQFSIELLNLNNNQLHTTPSSTSNIQGNNTTNNSESVIIYSNINKSIKENNCSINDISNQLMSNSPFREQDQGSQQPIQQYQPNKQRKNEQTHINQQNVNPNHKQPFNNKNISGFNASPVFQPNRTHQTNMQVICEVIERQNTNESSEKYLSPSLNENIYSHSGMNQSGSLPNSIQNSSQKQQSQFSSSKYSSPKNNKNQDTQSVGNAKFNLQFQQSSSSSLEQQQIINDDAKNNKQHLFDIQKPYFVLGQVKARVFLTDVEYQEFSKNKNNQSQNQIYNNKQNEKTDFTKCEMVYLSESQQIQLLFNSSLLQSSGENPAVVEAFSIFNINLNNLDLVPCPQYCLKISIKSEPTSQNKIILIQDNLIPATQNDVQDYFNEKNNLEILKQKVILIYKLRNNPQDLKDQIFQLEQNSSQQSQLSLLSQMNNENCISKIRLGHLQEETKNDINKIEEIQNEEKKLQSSSRKLCQQQNEQVEILKSKKKQILDLNQKQQNLINNSKKFDKKTDNLQKQRFDGNIRKVNEIMQINQIEDKKKTNQRNPDSSMNFEFKTKEKNYSNSQQINNQGMVVVNDFQQNFSNQPNSIDKEKNIENMFTIKSNDGQSNQISSIKREIIDDEKEDSLTNESHIKEFTNANNSPQSIQEFDNNHFSGSQSTENDQIRKQIKKVKSQFDSASSNLYCSRYKMSQNYSRTPEEEELIVFLKKFDDKEFIMKKFGQNSSSGQLRRIFFTSDFRFLCWKGVNSPQIKRIIPVDSLKNYILHGRNSENFKRFKTKNQNEASCSFSIVLNSRTIDLEAQNLQDKEFFINDHSYDLMDLYIKQCSWF